MNDNSVNDIKIIDENLSYKTFHLQNNIQSEVCFTSTFHKVENKKILTRYFN